MDWFQFGKGVRQSCILLPCLFNLYLEYIHVKCQAGWKKHKLESRLPGEIYNLRYTDETTLMAESEEQLKSLLMKVKEESEKAGLKPNIQNMKIMVSNLITSWQKDRETMATVTDFILGAPKSLQMVIAAMKLKDAYSLEEKLWPT